MKLLRDRSTFFCFTPLVSLITFGIELLLALYILFRFKLNKLSRIAVVLILLLGLFQLSEYMICISDIPLLWTRIGTASITLLPILGLHLISYLTKPATKTVLAGYGMGIGIMFVIFFIPALNLDSGCTGKFIALQTNLLPSIGYAIYYFGFLLFGLWKLTQHLLNGKGDKNAAAWMMVAYFSFLIPTAFIYLLYQLTLKGLPSILCGFAILTALIITFKVIPAYNGNNKKKVVAKKKKK